MLLVICRDYSSRTANDGLEDIYQPPYECRVQHKVFLMRYAYTRTLGPRTKTGCPVAATIVTLALVFYQPSDLIRKVLPQGWKPRDQAFLIAFPSTVRKQKHNREVKDIYYTSTPARWLTLRRHVIEPMRIEILCPAMSTRQDC